MQCNLAHEDALRVINHFCGTFAFVKPGLAEIGALSPLETEHLVQELAWRALLKGRKDAIETSTPDSWFFVGLNGVRLLLPRYTIMTMRNCITASADGTIDLMVETAHSDKMKAELFRWFAVPRCRSLYWSDVDPLRSQQIRRYPDRCVRALAARAQLPGSHRRAGT